MMLIVIEADKLSCKNTQMIKRMGAGVEQRRGKRLSSQGTLSSSQEYDSYCGMVNITVVLKVYYPQ